MRPVDEKTLSQRRASVFHVYKRQFVFLILFALCTSVVLISLHDSFSFYCLRALTTIRMAGILSIAQCDGPRHARLFLIYLVFLIVHAFRSAKVMLMKTQTYVAA